MNSYTTNPERLELTPEAFESIARHLYEDQPFEWDNYPEHTKELLRQRVYRALSGAMQGVTSDAAEQNEPSDAEVDAALRAADQCGPLTPIRERIKAALRAARCTQSWDQTRSEVHDG